jgi:Mrp family chromosome partitioning ATPase
MGAGHPTRLVSLIQRALSDGPVSQGDLISHLRQAGIRADLGVLWEVCRTHHLADLRDDLWVPMDWAPRSEAASAGVLTEPPTQSISTTQQPRTPAARRAAEWVQRLAESIGLGAPETVPPVGPVPAGWAAVAGSAKKALTDELARVRSRRTETDVPLLDGHLTGETATRQLVRFEAQNEIGSAEGNRATLIVGEQQFAAYVVSVFGAVVTLSVPPEAPVTSEATLRLDLSWLLIAQSIRLQQLTNGGQGFNAVAALAAVTPGPSVDGLAAPGPSSAVAPLTSRETDRLNDGQRRAVELALTPGVTWLWGPPGTGKTTTISALVAALVKRGKRVLLAAPTNAALDVAVTSVLDRAPHLADGGSLVRLGQPTEALSNRKILVDVVAADRGAPVAKERVGVGDRLKAARSELREFQLVKGQLSEDQQRRRSELEQVIAELDAVAEGLDELLATLRREVCRQATVVAATAHQTVLDTLRELTFDVVVLDEASMTNAALAMLVAGAGNGHTVIAGDFRQLPPVAVADTPAVREWLHKSPFEKAGVVRAVQDGRAPARLAALTEQYRMRPAIGHVVSTAFYPESPLVTADAVATRPRTSLIGWATGELLVVDTSGLRARTARRQGSASRYNLMHAQLVAGLLGAATTQTRDLAMITPFAAQARLLESLLPDFGLEGWAASTVHRFQGGERDIVVYDTVDTGHGISKLHSWFTDLDSDSTGTRLLNVAASRARDHLVVVGAFDELHRSGSSADPLWRFFAHLLDQAVGSAAPVGDSCSHAA